MLSVSKGYVLMAVSTSSPCICFTHHLSGLPCLPGELWVPVLAGLVYSNTGTNSALCFAWTARQWNKPRNLLFIYQKQLITATFQQMKIYLLSVSECDSKKPNQLERTPFFLFWAFPFPIRFYPFCLPGGFLKPWAEKMLNGCCCLLVTKSAPSLFERVRPAQVRSTEQLLGTGTAQRTFQIWAAWFSSASIGVCCETEPRFPGSAGLQEMSSWCSSCRSGCGEGGSYHHSSWQRCRNSDKQQRLSKTTF